MPNLVEFEIQRYADGVVNDSLPCTVMVDADDKRLLGHRTVCGCDGPFYVIRGIPDDMEVTGKPQDHLAAAVCLCMGRFVDV